MLALRKLGYGAGNVELVEVPKPTVTNDDDVLIRVMAAGVCGTDIHILNDEFKYYPPVTLGHEFSGVVEETGPGVEGFKPGDRIVAEPQAKSCMVCDVCRKGHWQICPHKRSPGWGIDGAFASHLVMPARLLHKIPEGVPDDIAALTEPLAVAVSNISERVKIFLSDFVVVVGSGPVGILSALVAKENGASNVVVLGVDSDESLRFKAALQLGADRVINVVKEDAFDIVSEMTGGKMADVVIEASGSRQGVITTFKMAGIRSRVCAVGLTPTDETAIPWNTAQLRMLDVYFNFSSSYTAWDRALKLLKNTRFDLSQLITHKEPLENWEQVFEDLSSGKGIKALFIPEV